MGQGDEDITVTATDSLGNTKEVTKTININTSVEAAIDYIIVLEADGSVSDTYNVGDTITFKFNKPISGCG